MEKEAVRLISEKENAVITTGGGAVLDPENRQRLAKNGWIVVLHASPETIYKRVKNSKKRPLLQGGDMLAEIKRLLEIRKPFYDHADFSLDTNGKSPMQVANLILKALGGKETTK